MTAIHVVVRSRSERDRSPAPGTHQGHFDVVVDGINVTARVGEGQALSVLAELGTALVELLAGRRTRNVVQLYSKDGAWELGLEVDGRYALVTVFKAGAVPEVAIAERPVELVALRHGVLEALASAKNAARSRSLLDAIGLAHRLLSSMQVAALPCRSTRDVTIAPRAIGNFAFRAEARLREMDGPRSPADVQLERSDLHSLSFPGSFGVTARGRNHSVAAVPIFLVAERLVELAREVLSARQQVRPLFRRVQVGTVRLGIRLAPVDAPMAFTLGAADVSNGSALTFPELDPTVFAQATVLFVRALRDTILSADPSQASNLKLSDLVAASNALAELARPVEADAALTNPRAEEYRRFSVVQTSPRPLGRWDSGVPLRFSSRWTASVPNIDLKSVLVNGDYCLIGALRETACLERHSGEVLWRHPSPRAGTLPIPSGFIRLFPDGKLSVHDLVTGQPRFSLRLMPRASGGAAGAVALASGLPKLIALTEGDRRVTAIDLNSGDVRWRYTARRPAALRVRRAGRLFVVGGGDSVLVALDVLTGETVWRAANHLPFTGDVAVEGAEAFALSAGAQGRGTLHHYDACSGELRWTADIDERPISGQSPLLTPTAVIVAVRDARGTGARAFDRKTGQDLWNIDSGQLPRQSGWVAVDDTVVVNGADATITGVEATTGALRYRHVLGHAMDPDVPRQIQPVLQGGAVFVPQQQVVVLRPRDGQMLGTVPTDLLPDVVRVDEQSSVYIAEESGHMACFSSAPMLVRIK